MYNKRRYIVKNIDIYTKIRKYLIFSSIFLIFIGLILFFTFGFYKNSNVIKFVAKYKDQDNVTIKKVMTNPKIKFEHSQGSYYNMSAKEAIHQDDEDILLFDVIADGDAVNIKAGKLLVSNNGNNLTFTDNPILIIKKTE